MMRDWLFINFYQLQSLEWFKSKSTREIHLELTPSVSDRPRVRVPALKGLYRAVTCIFSWRLRPVPPSTSRTETAAAEAFRSS
jgi:hypothetical protein